MRGIGNFSNQPYKKCARVVGEVLGKYHPHGDFSVYGALVRMGQDWNMRYKLVDGQGNFGSVDGDSAAAMRYTECRLSKMGEHVMDDIEKDTVDMVNNFDDTLREPAVMPTKIPNLLVMVVMVLLWVWQLISLRITLEKLLMVAVLILTIQRFLPMA